MESFKGKEEQSMTNMRQVSDYTMARESTLEKDALLQGKNTAKVLGYISQRVAKRGEKRPAASHTLGMIVEDTINGG